MDLNPSFIRIMALKINIVSNTLSINSLVLNPSETKIAVFEKNNTAAEYPDINNIDFLPSLRKLK